MTGKRKSGKAIAQEAGWLPCLFSCIFRALASRNKSALAASIASCAVGELKPADCCPPGGRGKRPPRRSNIRTDRCAQRRFGRPCGPARNAAPAACARAGYTHRMAVAHQVDASELAAQVGMCTGPARARTRSAQLLPAACSSAARDSRRLRGAVCRPVPNKRSVPSGRDKGACSDAWRRHNRASALP